MHVQVVANPNHAIVRIEGVNDKEATKFYYGKRVAYIYKAKREVKGSKYRCIWGKVVRSHGTGGAVRATFRRNLPPKAMVQILSPSFIDFCFRKARDVEDAVCFVDPESSVHRITYVGISEC